MQNARCACGYQLGSCKSVPLANSVRTHMVNKEDVTCKHTLRGRHTLSRGVQTMQGSKPFITFRQSSSHGMMGLPEALMA